MENQILLGVSFDFGVEVLIPEICQQPQSDPKAHSWRVNFGGKFTTNQPRNSEKDTWYSAACGTPDYTVMKYRKKYVVMCF